MTIIAMIWNTIFLLQNLYVSTFFISVLKAIEKDEANVSKLISDYVMKSKFLLRIFFIVLFTSAILDRHYKFKSNKLSESNVRFPEFLPKASNH